ncbi:MAG: hypothetical protein LM593_05770 [Candidatus Verstraetearchaeota archaeon]|nr:hypothetical protein [Candidatus Verstraetearchaeota archaeon]
MGIRIKLKLLVENKEIDVIALVNSGFESTEPDICIPLKLAEKIKLWPSSIFESEKVLTAGGEVSVFRLPLKAEIMLILDNNIKKRIPCNIVINPYVEEVLLSDYLIDELEIIPISFRKGLWRHKTDNESIIRESEKPQ